MARPHLCPLPVGQSHEEDPALSVALRADRHVRALCRCGVAVTLDVTPWAQEHAAPLTRFEDRVRCAACGARNVPLEIWYGPPNPRPQSVIYIFR